MLLPSIASNCARLQNWQQCAPLCPITAPLPLHLRSARHTSGKHSGNDFGKNGNAARLLPHIRSTKAAERFPEKISPRVGHLIPTIALAIPPAKNRQRYRQHLRQHLRQSYRQPPGTLSPNLSPRRRTLWRPQAPPGAVSTARRPPTIAPANPAAKIGNDLTTPSPHSFISPAGTSRSARDGDSAITARLARVKNESKTRKGPQNPHTSRHSRHPAPGMELGEISTQSWHYGVP